MYVRPGAPRSIGGVIDDAIRLYRASFARCWPLALLGALLIGLFNLYVLHLYGPLLNTVSLRGPGGRLTDLASAMAQLHAAERPGVWGVYPLITLTWLVFQAALIVRQHAQATNRTDSFAAALSFALRHLLSMVVAAIVWAIALTVGTLLLVVPAIWLWGKLQLWLAVMCAEDLGPFAALGKSWQLTDRNWWRTTTIVGVAAIIIAVVALSAEALGGVGLGLLGTDPATALLFTQLISIFVSIFTTPLFAVVMLAIYYDLKLRREGGDLAARLSTLQTA